MPKVSLKHEKESFESLFRRWKRAVDKDDTLKLLREREFYEKPSVHRKRQKAGAVKREARRQMEQNINRRSV
jgi:small subunit ribosomal protein S21